MHETHGKLESRQNIPVVLFLAARGEQVRLLPVLRIPGSKAENIVEVAILLAGALRHFTRYEILSNTFRGKIG